MESQFHWHIYSSIQLQTLEQSLSTIIPADMVGIWHKSSSKVHEDAISCHRHCSSEEGETFFDSCSSFRWHWRRRRLRLHLSLRGGPRRCGSPLCRQPCRRRNSRAEFSAGTVRITRKMVAWLPFEFLLHAYVLFLQLHVTFKYRMGK